MSLVNFKAGNHPQQTAKRGARDDVDDRGTDPAFIASLEERFGKFTLDVAAAPHNAKAPEFYTREDDGLTKPWRGNVWCNPPYSDCGAWVRKAWSEWRGSDPRVPDDHYHQLARDAAPWRIAMLLPANRVEQGWWQDYVEALRIFEPEDDFWAPLVGRDLACWCPLDQPCHADVLLEIANRGAA